MTVVGGGGGRAREVPRFGLLPFWLCAAFAVGGVFLAVRGSCFVKVQAGSVGLMCCES